jgi:hypothetical protein
MLVFFSARRLKGDQWDEFRNAWAGGTDEAPEGLPEGSVVYHARNIKDDNEVISFGIFDIDRDSLDLVRGSEEDELKRQEEIGKYVHDVPLEGVYEVVEELRP